MLWLFSACSLDIPVLHTGAGQARARPGQAETPESRTVPWAILVSVLSPGLQGQVRAGGGERWEIFLMSPVKNNPENNISHGTSEEY